jgi:NAD(P)-dependent dehydrogenase (short-subunit alcohol dehydrogenase family)
MGEAGGSALCEGRVIIVTGAGRGIGRGEALECARQGARVVVNNRSPDPAHEAVEAIRAAGGEAVAHVGDVSDMTVAGELLGVALEAFGRLDVLVNNAGMVRDRMFVNMSVEEWDEAVRVNLRGVFATMSHAARYWRQQSKEHGRQQAAIINTTSSAGLYRNPGQANYAAAKAGVASLTINGAYELANYGVTVNGLAPTAATSMSEHLIDPAKRDVGGFDPYAVDNVGPLVAWLASLEARHVTGRIFDIKGGRIAVAEGWRLGPEIDIGRRWRADEIGQPIAELLAKARPNVDVSGRE